MVLLFAALSLPGVRMASAANYPTTILADKPVAYYRFEDASGSGRNGPWMQPAMDLMVPSIMTRTFNGNTDYPETGRGGHRYQLGILFHNYTDSNALAHSESVVVANDPAMNPTGPFSIEFCGARPISDANTYESSGWEFCRVQF